ncbi:hypothetical protein Sta7437_1700 [Stanieria cyanosphaera PCC 7437]|uniref:Uncharacterized protein n=1 Tax=Stanieria cyanosphaera (strain ATCC 29371 / PCC 7437) TaxID=111780 RepID=K9XUB1_STAC7|nr:hypothetical protein Sta7437_1700 [Stanieria cyanosphaera PCC 7437]
MFIYSDPKSFVKITSAICLSSLTIFMTQIGLLYQAKSKEFTSANRILNLTFLALTKSSEYPGL